MQTTVTDLCRTVLMRGEGLRPILRYARKSPVNFIRVDVLVSDPTRYAVTFYFADGSEGTTRWASWRVLLDWVEARRSWSVERIRFAHPGTFAEAHAEPATARIRASGTTVCGPYVQAV